MVPKTVLETVGGSMHGLWQNVKQKVAGSAEAPPATAVSGARG
jgi:hypothetical protein